MDEAKRKYLDDLKKQIDPEMLKKMAEHMGKGGDESAAAYSALTTSDSGSSGSASNAGFSGPQSNADKSRDRRASAFQQRIAERKRQELVRQPDASNKDDVRRKVFIYSHNDIWSRIADSQFKNLGFHESVVFKDFEPMIRSLLEQVGKSDITIMVSISLLKITKFLKAWFKLKEQMASSGKEEVLASVEYVLLVETMRQVPDEIIQIIGMDRIINITDEIQDNREKICVLLNKKSADSSGTPAS
ncbi:hypothetical protein KAR48_12120 [bacterium]|nr:hypothetical protein [bacterium]